jgi:Nucleotidyltransferase substrate binding protein like
MTQEELTNQITYLGKAIERLHAAIAHDDLGDFMRESIIQRFEYCIELAWKTSKKVLEIHFDELGIYSPKEAMKKAYEK